MVTSNTLPELPFKAWTKTRLTVHIILQILGKTRLKSTTRKNHWWYITLYVSSRGFSTHEIPIHNGLESVEIEFNVKRKAVVMRVSTGEEITMSLANSPTIADFYKAYLNKLGSLGLHPNFVETPFDLEIEKPFETITEYHHYDWEYIEKFWKIMLWNHNVFQEFGGRFYGKTCPVHIYWHHLDLVVTRFSGKKLPPMDRATRIIEKETYSHEQISFGFWVGDKNIPEPMYYSYTYPSPDGISEEPLQPKEAHWQDSNGSPMALLRYEDVRSTNHPRKTVLDFLESTYQAGAKKAGWNIDELKVPDLDQL